jgi:hypothetical protein
MARKFMTKEVTVSAIKTVEITVDENGMPVASQNEPIIVIGNVTKEKAQKMVTKKFGQGVTVYAVELITKTYKMEVSEFIKVATLVLDDEIIDENDDDDDDENGDENGDENKNENKDEKAE